MWRSLPLLAILCAHTRLEGGALQITSLLVPPFVVNNSGLVVLDCQYTLNPVDLQSDSGLVVKWFFNNGPAPVYQWIPGQRPQDLGVLRGRLDLDHRASDNNATVFRALSILNPTTELTGEYRCAVSTFTDEDFMIQKMIVYAPERRMELLHDKPGMDSVNITCTSMGLYPEPRIAMYQEPFTPRVRFSFSMTLYTIQLSTCSSKPLQGVIVETSSKGGHYDILASRLFYDSELITPSTFICEVCIPTTEYCRRKRLVYYPGVPYYRSMASYSADGGAITSVGLVTWLALLILQLLH